MHQLLLNSGLLSHGSFVLPSECTAHNYASDLYGNRSANILSGNNCKLIHTQNKFPCFKVYQLTKHYGGHCSVPLLQDYTIVRCQLWVGFETLLGASAKT
jgi:hypothetical protein